MNGTEYKYSDSQEENKLKWLVKLKRTTIGDVPQSSAPHRGERMCLLGDQCAKNENLGGAKVSCKKKAADKTIRELSNGELHSYKNNY